MALLKLIPLAGAEFSAALHLRPGLTQAAATTGALQATSMARYALMSNVRTAGAASAGRGAAAGAPARARAACAPGRVGWPTATARASASATSWPSRGRRKGSDAMSSRASTPSATNSAPGAAQHRRSTPYRQLLLLAVALFGALRS